MAAEQWYFGLERAGGGYRIAAADPDRAKVQRQLRGIAVPTLVVTHDELLPLGISTTEIAKWLPRDERE